MSRAAAAGQTVLFFEEPVFSDSGERPRLETTRQSCGVVVAVPILKHGMSVDEQTRAQQTLLNGLLRAHRPLALTVWYYTPMALRFTSHLRPALCIYDCMDELSAFKFAPPALVELEGCLIERAHLIFAGGRSLYHAKRGRHADCHLFPSSVDVAHFARARDGATREPADQAAIPYPRVGFSGVIDERMDLQLVARLAELRPDLQLIFIGPVVKIDPASLPQARNIHWVGPRNYAQLPEYLSGWDAAFMPFALNESTRFISPTKTPEFLAAGLGVCSTPIADVVTPYGNLGLVEIAADAASFSESLDRLLQHPARDWQERADAQLRGMSWDDTWSRMRALMERANERRTGERRAVDDPEYDSDHGAAFAGAGRGALRV